MRRGLAAIKSCKSVSLGLEIRHGWGPMAPLRAPTQHFMRRDGGDYCTGAKTEKGRFGFSDDVIMLSTHGTTHIDALCHVFCDGMMFGDIPASEVSSSGAGKLGAETIPPIATRAIIVDAVTDGRDWLDAGEEVHAADLRDRIRNAGLALEPGDALLVRTGSLRAFQNGVVQDRSWPGLSADCIDWLRTEKVAVVGADNLAVEVNPSKVEGLATPLHQTLMREDGVMLVELLDLEVFAGRTLEGFLTINPLRIVGGTASPVNPVLML
ncbi:MAG TPA: cyclase family protein [Paracoccus sp.]|nr:cyclase family protein [Paracoccus sp. (in: a-proteobacteria)]